MLKRNKRHDYPSLQDVYSRVRGFILDSQIDDPHEIAVVLGCPKISEDVAEMEEEASENRVEQIAHLSPFIIFFAKTIAEGLVETQRIEDTQNEIPKEVWLNTKRLVEHTAVSALMGALPQLIELRLLEIPKRRRK